MPSLLDKLLADKDPEEIATVILDLLEAASVDSPDLRLLLQQRAAFGDAIALAVEERSCRRREREEVQR
jgi:hypothetical protein